VQVVRDGVEIEGVNERTCPNTPCEGPERTRRKKDLIASLRVSMGTRAKWATGMHMTGPRGTCGIRLARK
jgi:hypothetical protein